MVGSFGGGGHYNPDEPRDEKGRWVASIQGKTPSQRRAAWRRRPLFDMSGAGRGASLLHHAALSLPDRARRRFEIGGPAEGARLGRLIDRWNGASALDDEAFQDQFLENKAPLETVRILRLAAKGAAQAQTDGDMADASKHLATAIQDVGPDRWPRFLKAADEIAANQPEPTQRDALAPEGFVPGLLEKSTPQLNSFLEPLPEAQLSWISRFGSLLLRLARWAPVAAFGLIFIPSNKNTVESGALPGINKINYRLDKPEGTLDLTVESKIGGPPVVIRATTGLDGILRDKDGHPLARWLDGKLLIDAAAIVDAVRKIITESGRKPEEYVDSDQDEPKLCPNPGPDVEGGTSARAIAYENYVSTNVNPESPLIRTRDNRIGVNLMNPVTGRWVSYDDCIRKTGTMVDAKGPGYAKPLYNYLHNGYGKGVVRKLVNQANKQIEAAKGRNIVWFFAEKAAAEAAKLIFHALKLDTINIVYLPMLGEKEWTPSDKKAGAKK